MAIRSKVEAFVSERMTEGCIPCTHDGMVRDLLRLVDEAAEPGAVEAVQQELPGWVERQQFKGDHTPDRSALGMVEEVGEACAALLAETRFVQKYDSRATVLLAIAGYLGVLARVELKGQQGIRYEQGEGVKAEIDATCSLSQLVHIFVAGYGDSSRRAIEDIWRGTGLHEGPAFPRPEGDVATELADVLTFAAELANTRGIPLGAALLSRWARVRQRDWARDPRHGGEEPPSDELLLGGLLGEGDSYAG